MGATRTFSFTWVAVSGGRLSTWHRPKLRAIRYLPAAGCDRLVTLLSEREGAREIGAAVEEAGMAWTWLPLASGNPPEGRQDARIRSGVETLAEYLAAGESILLHCSAGIHRTGMIALALLRLCGLEEDAALELLERARPHTRHGLRSKHLEWGNRPVVGTGATP